MRRFVGLLLAAFVVGTGPRARAGLDLYGDHLPPGAVARVGTVRDLIGLGSSELAFSRDGKTITATSGFWNVPLRLWETGTGRVLRPLPQLADRAGVACAVAFSPDGDLMAAGDNQGKVRVGKVETGRKLYELAVAAGPIRSLMFSGDGKVLAVGSGDASTVWFWDAGRGRKLRGLDAGEFTRSVALGREGKTLAVGRRDGTVAILDVATGRTVRRLWGHTEPVNCVRFAPGGRLEPMPVLLALPTGLCHPAGQDGSPGESRRSDPGWVAGETTLPGLASRSRPRRGYGR